MMIIKLIRKLKLPIIFLSVLILFISHQYISLYKEALIDDAYITFQYARNLRDYHSWGIFPNTTTNTATSPLNIILTSVTGFVFDDIVDASLWLAALEATIFLFSLLRISKLEWGDYYYGILGFIITMMNPLLVSTYGMETMLYVMFIGLCVLLFRIKRWNWLAVCLSLMTLTRADGVLLFMIVGIMILRNSDIPIKEKILFLSVYTVSLTPWYLFSWLHLGSLIPDTFFLKFNQNWSGISYVTGISLYFFRYPLETLYSFILAPIGIWYVLKHKRKTQATGMLFFLFGFFYLGAYSILRVPPYHWYYTPVSVSLNLLGIYSIFAEFFPSNGETVKKMPKRILLIGFIILLAIGAGIIGISKSPIQESPVHTNWATSSQYREIGLWINQHIEPSNKIKLAGEIGTLVYFSERQLLDMFSCRNEMQLRINRLYQKGGLVEVLARLNFYWFSPGDPCWPQDYLLGFVESHDDLNNLGYPILKSWQTSTRWIPEGLVGLWKLSTP